MISELLKKTDIQSWSAITLQVAVLVANITLFFKGYQNSYVILSSTLILTLFCLQVISRRFLMLYPIQGFLNYPTAKIDTTILRCMIIFGISLLLLGTVMPQSSVLIGINKIIVQILKYIIPILIPIFPLTWHFFFNSLVRKKLIEDLKNVETKLSVSCPNPDCHFPFATATKRIQSQNEGTINIECEKCGKQYIKLESINIGY